LNILSNILLLISARFSALSQFSVLLNKSAAAAGPL
jgi:hypothetical protein